MIGEVKRGDCPHGMHDCREDIEVLSLVRIHFLSFPLSLLRNPARVFRNATRVFHQSRSTLHRKMPQRVLRRAVVVGSIFRISALPLVVRTTRCASSILRIFQSLNQALLFQAINQAGHIRTMHDQFPAQLRLVRAFRIIAQQVQHIETGWDSVPSDRKTPDSIPREIRPYAIIAEEPHTGDPALPWGKTCIISTSILFICQLNDLGITAADRNNMRSGRCESSDLLRQPIRNSLQIPLQQRGRPEDPSSTPERNRPTSSPPPRCGTVARDSPQRWAWDREPGRS